MNCYLSIKNYLLIIKLIEQFNRLECNGVKLKLAGRNGKNIFFFRINCEEKFGY